MAKNLTRFSPNRDGFQFLNRFEIKLPVRYDLPFGGAVNLNEVVFGLCGGMCFSALDYFHAGLEHPSYHQVEEIDTRLLAYLCDRQLDSLSLPTVLKLIEWIFLNDTKLAARVSQYEAPKVRRMIDRGEPAVLALIRSHGFEDPTRNHQVLATGYEIDPAVQTMRIFLYEPNYPEREPFLDLSLVKGKPALTQSTGEPLRGFFVIPYRRILRVPPTAEQLRDLLAREALPFRLGWPVDSRRVNQFFGENPESYRPFGLPGHEGLDLFALSGANIYAAADGEVIEADHPSNHPYGLQVRIRHTAGGKAFQTIYAHLHETSVQVGQKVSQGQQIGQADNSGNSFGSHLHLTLKIEGEKTRGYPAGIVDPWPYLQAGEIQPQKVDESLPASSGVQAYTTGQVNLRAGPSLEVEILALLPAGEALDLLGEAAVVRAKIGQLDTWLPVRTASGQGGYVAAWFLQSAEQTFPPSDMVVYPSDAANLRSGPGTAFGLLGTVPERAPLTVLGSADAALAKLGRQGEWIQVLTVDGRRGFVAAWLVHRTGEIPVSTGLTVYPKDILNVRSGPALDANVLTVVSPGDALTVLGDAQATKGRIGQADAWLNVRTPGNFSGYVAAWLVSPAAGGPEPNAGLLKLYPTAALNLHAQASTNSPRAGSATRGEQLTVMEADQEAARRKVGQAGQWIYIQKETKEGGWVQGELVSLDKP